MKNKNIYLVAGLRTPFVKIDREYKDLGAIELSVPSPGVSIPSYGVTQELGKVNDY